MSGTRGDNKESRLQIKPGTEDIVQLKTNEMRLGQEITKLKSEIKFLTEINNRLNKQVIAYHNKYGISPLPNSGLEGDKDEIMALPPNLHEFNFLAPLFSAYDAKIKGLENALNKATEDITELNRQSEMIIDDNNVLRAKLEQKSQALLDIYKGGKTDDNLIASFYNLEKEDMNERMKLLNEENNTLLSNLKELNTKFQNLQKHYDMQHDENDGVLTRYSELSKRNKQLEVDNEDLKKMRDVLGVKYKNSTDELSKLELEREELVNKVNKIENELKIARSQLNNSKKSFGELEDKKQTEVDVLNKEIESLRLKEREFANKLIFMEREFDGTKEENRRLKKELQNTKNDADQMLKVMESFESKVALYQRKEEQMNRLTKESKEKVEEALLQRDRVLLKEEHYQKTIDNLTESHRQEVQSVKENYDRMIENLRAKQKTTLDSRDTELKSLNDELNRVQHHHDKILKENKNLKQEYNKLNAVVKDHSSKEEERYAQYEQKIAELEEKNLRIEQEYGEKVRFLSRDKDNLETSSKDLSSTVNELKATNETLRSSNTALSGENTSLKSKLSNIQRERQNFLEEIDKIKKNYETQISIYAEDYSAKMREMEEQMQDSIQKEKVTREKTLELLKTHEKIEDKLKKELENNIRHYEKVVADLKNENRYISQKLQDARR